MPIDKNADNIQVMVRVRPLNSRERSEEAKSCITVDEETRTSLAIDCKPDQKIFSYDWIGGESTTQQMIFEVVGMPMVAACLEAFNCCIFAYGQTGAGKTFTMQGKGLEPDNNDIESRGLQPRVFDYIFHRTKEETEKDPNLQYLISCSYLEIYNEQILDLLDPSNTNLQIREDLKKGVYVDGVREQIVTNSDETIELLRLGAQNRHVGATKMNFESSRSHSVFSMNIESKRTLNGMIQVKSSKFHFVDLAGSERQKSTAASGERLKEAANINKSLTVLGSVINSLVEIAEGKQRHVRYRDSKLTFLLKDSLGGNSKTCIIANVSPANSSFSETLSTLKFAQRAKQIKNKASVNEEASGSVDSLKKEIKRLKEELTAAQAVVASLKENGERFHYRSPKLTPQGFVMNERQILEQNQRALEIEIAYKQAMDSLIESQLLQQTELEKAKESAEVMRSAVEFFTANEVHYRTIIRGQAERIQRLNSMIESKHIDFDMHLRNEINSTQLENDQLKELLMNMPLVMRVCDENVMLRQLLDDFEGESNPNSSSSVVSQIQDSVFLLKEWAAKLEENIKERKFISEKLGRMSVFKGLSSPEKHQKMEEQINLLTQQHEHQQEMLRMELQNSNFELKEAIRQLSNEKQRVESMIREKEALMKSKLTEQESYEKRISNLLNSFEQLQQDKKLSDNHLENEISELKFKQVQILEQLQKAENSNQDLKATLQEITIAKEFLEQSKATLENDFNAARTKFVSERTELQTAVNALEGKILDLTTSLSTSKDEVDRLTKQIEVLFEEANAAALTIDQLSQENCTLLEKADLLESEKAQKVIALEKIITQAELLKEEAEAENNRLKEELDTTKQTLAFMTDESEKKVSELTLQLKGLNSTVKQYEKSIKENDLTIAALKDELFQMKKEDSIYSVALRENPLLRTRIGELELDLENQVKKSQLLDEELQELQGMYRRIHKSEEDFRNAYHEMKEEYDKLRQENEAKTSELQQKEEIIRSLKENIEERVNELKITKESAEAKYAGYETRLHMQETVQNQLNIQISDWQSKYNTLSIDVEAERRASEELKEALESQVLTYTQQFEELFLVESQGSDLDIDSLGKQQSSSNPLSEEERAIFESKNIVEKMRILISKILQRTKEKQAETRQLIQALESVKQASQQKLQEKDEELSQCSKKIQSLQQEIEAISQKMQEADLEHKEVILALKQAEIENIEQATKVAKEKIQEQEALIEELQRTNQDYEKKCEMLQETKLQLDEAVERLEQMILDKNQQLTTCNESLLSLKDQLESYWDVISQLNEIDRLKEENSLLKEQVENQSFKVGALETQTANHLIVNESELQRLKNAHFKLEAQHRTIIAAAAVKETELQKQREEIKLLLIEKKRLMSEILNLEEQGAKLKSALKESEEVNLKLRNERLAIQIETEEALQKKILALEPMSDKANEQRARHYLSLKEENKKLREENTKLLERVNRMGERNDKFEKKGDEALKKSCSLTDQNKLAGNKQDDYHRIQSELDREKRNTKSLTEIINKIREIATEQMDVAPLKECAADDLETSVRVVQELLDHFKTKERMLQDKELELEAQSVERVILEKELALIKQKYALSNSAMQERMFNLSDEKENIWEESDANNDSNNAPIKNSFNSQNSCTSLNEKGCKSGSLIPEKTRKIVSVCGKKTMNSSAAALLLSKFQKKASLDIDKRKAASGPQIQNVIKRLDMNTEPNEYDEAYKQQFATKKVKLKF